MAQCTAKPGEVKIKSPDTHIHRQCVLDHCECQYIIITAILLPGRIIVQSGKITGSRNSQHRRQNWRREGHVWKVVVKMKNLWQKRKATFREIIKKTALHPSMTHHLLLHNKICLVTFLSLMCKGVGLPPTTLKTAMNTLKIDLLCQCLILSANLGALIVLKSESI